MKILKCTVLFFSLSAVNLAWADVPVVDAYQQADNNPSNNNSQSSINQANTNLTDNSQTDSAQSAGIDLSQTQAQSPATAQTAPQNSNLPINQRVQILEQQAANSTQLINQMNNLQQQVQELRGQLETQTHDMQVLQDQLRTQYKDLDQRLSQADTSKPTSSSATVKGSKDSGKKATVSTSSSTGTEEVVTNSKKDPDNKVLSGASTTAGADSGPPVPPPAPKVAVTKDQVAYQHAFDLLRDKKYDQATNAFQDFLETYPTGKSVVNAHYWLGQLFLLQGQPDSAIEQFKTILQTNPGGSKVPDSMVQLGLAYYAKGDLVHAKAQLAQVQQAFPDSPAAKLAKSRLRQIVQANVGSPAMNGTG